MSAHVDFNFFHVCFHIFHRGKILPENRCQMSAAGDAVQILFPFFQKDFIEGVLGFDDTEQSHDFGVQKVVFKGIIAQNQHVLRTNPGKHIHIFQIPLFIVAAELLSQPGWVVAVAVPDHQKLISKIDLVHVFQICVGLDVGTAVGGEDGDSGQISVRIIGFGIIFPKQQRETALVLSSLHDKDKVHVHQIARRIAEIIQNGADIRLLPDAGTALFVQNHLTDLHAVEIGQKIGRMGERSPDPRS